MDALKESLAEKIEDESDPNTAPFRYILVLDPTDNEVALSLLFDRHLCSATETDVCHVADFPEDASELARSNVVLQVKNAMATGRTVILVNAMPISTSFYDVLNRHFDVLPVQSGDPTKRRFEYFANIAVGSFSRPCFVHPDFRVIVHLPVSQLANTPRPFLNRFEKYLLSFDSVLSARIKEEFSVEQRSQFSALREGCEDMITKLHATHQSSLFYGLVPKETLSSLLLTVLEKTKLSNTTYPTVPGIFHINEEPAEPPMDDSTDPIVESIRKTNFHLLQLARPEAVFSTNQFRDPYLREYLLRQEHFSVVRLLSRIKINYTSTELPVASICKWCIFTRTCSELSRLHKDSVLRNSFLGCIGQDNSDRDWVSVLALHTIPSSKFCEDEVRKYAQDKEKKLLLCIADLNVCSASQINFLRSTVDTIVQPSRLVVFLLHLPPEMLLLHSLAASNAVFVNGWNYAYVDSLGISSSQDSTEVHEEVDSKTWLAHAYGLDVRISKESVRKAFDAMFMKHLKSCCTRIAACLQPPRSRAYLMHSASFYIGKIPGARRNPEDLFQFLANLLHQPLNLIDHILAKFRSAWEKTLLTEVVHEACGMIQQGKVTTNLLSVVSSSLQHLLGPVVTYLMRVICSNYNLEAIAYISVKDRIKEDVEEELNIVKLVLRSTEIPKLSDLLTNTSTYSIAPIAISREFEFPSHFPLFDVVAVQIQKLLEDAKASIHKVERTPITLAEALQKKIFVNAQLRKITQAISSSPHLLGLYKRDFITRTLRLFSVYAPRHSENSVWLDVCVKILDSITEGDTSLIHLHVVPEFHASEFAYFPVCLAPLQKLEPVPNKHDIENLAMAKVTDVKEVDNYVLLLTIRLLWDRLQSLHTLPENDAVSCLENFAKTFGRLRARLSCTPRGQLGYLLRTVEDRFKYDLENIILLFMVNVCSQADTALKPVLAAISSFSGGEAHETGLYNILVITSKMLLAISAEIATPVATFRFICDIITFVLGYSSANEENFPSSLKKDCLFFLDVIFFYFFTLILSGCHSSRTSSRASATFENPLSIVVPQFYSILDKD